MTYNETFAATCTTCKIKQVPFLDEVADDGTFECVNGCGIVSISNFDKKLEAWSEQVKNNRAACFD